MDKMQLAIIEKLAKKHNIDTSIARKLLVYSFGGRNFGQTLKTRNALIKVKHFGTMETKGKAKRYIDQRKKQIDLLIKNQVPTKKSIDF